MTEIGNTGDDQTGGPPLGWKVPVIVLALYSACVSIATFPVVTRLRSTLPGGYVDAYQHLWIMRWYQSCLFHGRSPVFCPDLQYPVGAPLGLFSPLHWQSMLFIPLSMALKNDFLAYNLIWFSSLVLTGMGTFVLAWYVVRDRACAALAGMLAMLSTPILMHAHGHIELVMVGWFPVFLVAWMRFVDRPGRGRLAASVVLYVLVAMSAAYFAIFAVFPAALYVAWSWARAGRGELWPWLRGRAGWLLGFSALLLPCLAVLFWNQIWAPTHGFPTTRPRSDYARFFAPPWSYFVPTVLHPLHEVLPFDPYGLAKVSGEGFSYLGVVMLFLLAYAAVRRVRFPRSRFFWAAALMLAVLSFGTQWHIGSHRVGLPAGWFRDHVFIFRFIRVPARFNMFVAVLAAVVAAAALRHLLDRVRRPWVRATVPWALGLIALADLSTVPFHHEPTPAMPACYALLKQRDPGAAVFEAPHYGYTGADYLAAACGYWQSYHQLKSSAGYSGVVNVRGDNLVTYSSPFWIAWLRNPNYLNDPDDVRVDLANRVRFDDYVWLYLTVHKFDYIVLHQWELPIPEPPMVLDQVKARLRGARIFEDPMTTVYERNRLHRPTRPVLLGTTGWRQRGAWRGKYAAVASKAAQVAVYNPEPGRKLTFTIEAFALHRPRTVRLMAGARELARWEVEPGAYRLCSSPSFRLPEGLQELTVQSDAEEPPARRHEAAAEDDMTPYSLRVSAMALLETDPEVSPPARVATGPNPAEERR